MKIPTISELLDSPQLKPWVERASRNVVVTSAKSFVSRLASDLQTRAAEMNIPTPSELAQRIADWIASRQAKAPHAEINATGVLLPAHASLPLADEAIHSLGTLRDYTTDDALTSSSGVISELARQLTGAEAALVTGTHAGAMLLSLAALCEARPVVIARGQVGEIEGGVSLPSLAKTAGVPLRECGIVDRVSLADYEEALPGAGMALAVCGERSEVELAQLASLARRMEVPLVVHLGHGGIVDASKYGVAGLVTASEAIAAGADLVVLAGNRMLGGPACGVVFGRVSAIERLRRHGLFASLAATSATRLALATTLELHQDLETAERAIPLLSLLSTSVENLKGRGERLAPQLAASSLVASAVVTEGTASFRAGGPPISTWQVVVEPQQGTAEELAARLKAASPPIVVLVRNQRLVIDLRSVLPRQDMAIADAFASVGNHAAKDPPLSPA